MTPERKDNVRIADILEAIARVEKYLHGVSKAGFVDDYKLQCTIVRQFEIIGEAANHLSAPLKDNHSEIIWHEVIGMRNRMIHDYSEVDLTRVWETAQKDLPILKQQVEKILKGF